MNSFKVGSKDINEMKKLLTDLDFEVRILGEDETVKSFDCGDDDLNDFILHTAPLYKSEMLAETFIVEDNQGKVLAYFSLATDKITLSEFEGKTEFNRFRRKHFPNEKRLKAYPAVKICRFAVDLSARQYHLGSTLLQYIKWKIWTEVELGCRYITVDAYLVAIPFYEKNDFKILTASDAEDRHTRLLFFDMKQFKRAMKNE